MPSLPFVLPHWLYWSALVLLPLLAMVLVRRQQGRRLHVGLSYPTAYMLWLCAGFLGIHRFYVKSWLGVVFIPLFCLILFGNSQVKEATNALSGAKNNLSIAEFELERAQAAVAKEAEGAPQKLTQAEQAAASAKQSLAQANRGYATWSRNTGRLAAVLAVLLLIDACLLPGLVRKCAASEAETARAAEAMVASDAQGLGVPDEATRHPRSTFARWTDHINGFAGEFVAYWAVLAVFVYYYEVLARYVFNSPTNWAHESMFLMFGMQYMLAGAYTYREDGHVRVDVLYAFLPDRIKALVDVVTSLFFFIFAVALLWTGWVFMADSIAVWEVSFTEWAIQYWPVKITMALGALLLIMQGLAKLFKDMAILTGKQA